jgi:hypothetical protein
MPSSKKLRGKICIYCGANNATTWDHVVARGLFANFEIYRANSPQVPCCGECNTLKSEVENSLLIIMQFGGESNASRDMLNEKMDRVLAGNKKMHRDIASRYTLFNGNPEFRIDGRILANLSSWNKYIAKALYYLWRDEIFDAGWKLLVVNTPNVDAYFYFRDMIAASANHNKYKIGKLDAEWEMSIAESEDGLILTNFEFNSISQFTLIFKNPGNDLIKDWERLGY